VNVRITLITESFPPDVNGVAHCVLRVADHLISNGHQLQVIAPRPPGSLASPDRDLPYEVLRVASLPMPGYSTFRIAVPLQHLRAALTRHHTELVHLAGPFLLGAGGALAARRLGLPVVAVYQTDMPSYARAYHYGKAGQAVAWRRLRKIHNGAERTLAPSSSAAANLHAHGVERVWLWGRGVDTALFDPARRSEKLRAELAPHGEVIAGYVGRIAPEKRVDLLAQVAALPGVRLVVVGSGPADDAVRRAMPGAAFLGQRRGEDLATIYASLDVFVHSGPHETFGQTLQEAAASGLPVVAPAAGGPLDLVDDGVTGFLVTPGDAGALARAVTRLAADPGLRAAQGRAARQRVLGRTWQTLGDELIGHYEAVLATERALEVPA
jgi:phosphatidylinositol alpha 1,6-mannosyltransferase